MTVYIFSSIGLEMNLEKTKVVVFTPGFIWGNIGKVTYKQRVTGGGGDVSGEEKDKGKLIRMRRNNGGFINTAPHGSITWGDPTTDVGR